MRLLTAQPIALVLLILCQSPTPAQGKVVAPFNHFLLQQPPFEVATESSTGTDGKRISKDVPLVMRLLFKESEKVSHSHEVPQGGDFFSLARSVRPTNIKEEGLQKVVLDFPKVVPADKKPGVEGWLVFQLRESYILANNCTQMLSVYVKDKTSLKHVTAVPLTYKTGDPLLVVNVTSSLRLWGKKNSPSYVATIRDTTQYTTDRSLRSFSNYIDCTLARACEVLELHNPDTSPVLLLLSSELAAHAATNIMDSETRKRRDVSADASMDEDDSEENSPTDHYEDKDYCHLMEWSVDVERLGWEWLIYPERIPLNLCVGPCPDILGYHYNATSHAVARGLYRMMMGHDTKPENTEPCCVPVKYRRFSMLIEKRPGVISLETSSDLLAVRCGCR